MKNYIGLPTPAAAVVIVLSAAVLDNQTLVLVIAIVMSFVMISTIQYPKLRGVIGMGGGVAIAVGILALFLDEDISQSILSAVMILAIVYLVIGPYYALKFTGGSNEQGR